MKIEFTVPGEPRGKGRPRVCRNDHTYTPKETASYENLVKLEYERQCPLKRFEPGTMLKMSIAAYYKIPKSASKVKRRKMLLGDLRPTKKPDMDNVIKIIADSLNSLAYHDDAQIVSAVVDKYYDDVPRVDVYLEDVEPCGKKS